MKREQLNVVVASAAYTVIIAVFAMLNFWFELVEQNNIPRQPLRIEDYIEMQTCNNFCMGRRIVMWCMFEWSRIHFSN